MNLIQSRILVLVFAALCAALAGCGGAILTPQEIDAYGTKSYPSPREKLTEDITTVLKTLGYEVVVSDAEKGLVTTARKEIGSQSYTSARSGRSMTSARTMSTSYYRQYVVKISDGSSGSKVRVTPKVFIGERDVSSEKVWNIEGKGGERELWANLFSELEAMN